MASISQVKAIVSRFRNPLLNNMITILSSKKHSFVIRTGVDNVGRRFIRRGIAAVEAAVTFPVLILVVFGLLQLNQMAHLRKQLTLACLSGMQVLSQPEATEAEVQNTVISLLRSQGVRDFTVKIIPAGTLNNASRGTDFSIVVSCDLSRNLAIKHIVPASTSITVEQHVYR